MQTITKKLKKSIIVLIIILTAGCNSWLDIDPVGVQTSGTFWKTKEEVEQVLIGSYMHLRECMPMFLKWGEVRGDALSFGPKHDTDNSNITQGERLIKRLDIRPDNPLTLWNDVYTVIGRANSVIDFSATALTTDATFAESLSNSYVAEAIFIRSLCYFYLVRTFKDVPFVLEFYNDDSEDFFAEKTESHVIISRLIADLEEHKNKVKPGYENPWQSKGRATSWSFKALLADIYLWRGESTDYQKVLDIAREFEQSPYRLVGLNSKNEEDPWISIYYPGNSDEGIFELQYENLPDQRNQLYNWFWGGRYVISLASRDVFEKDDIGEFDIRGYNSGYGESSEGKLWKYAGTKNSKGNFTQGIRNKNVPANWIFYRYADILLMKAEALAMTGDFAGVSLALEPILKRAGYQQTTPTVPSDELGALELVMKERQKEFHVHAVAKRHRAGNRNQSLARG